ncbi:Paraquat-inducible protein A [Desulfobulbus propionicus DSM 2032]|uniref:Paraquat-inducible protein A n=1 Tax=Desulfobulbus propionicus (strain ATCC 33891 / DSM 2032 / VKM B-1956 / 1pr3) TaxID=577650 RepID=A0A7U3YL53_DESPD|nr:paraquat-inducible protein A [Desulfobulbus propionicus]ADW17402.1 Paraquat-inducible protein A [Desulfobulbus propionicus DSM 2032]
MPIDQPPPTVIACPDCDLLNRLPAEATTVTLLCGRCGAVLARHKPDSIERSLALTLTALILFVVSNSFPFLAMKTGGFVQETTLLTGIRELWKQDMQGLSCLVLLTCVLVPGLQMIGLLYILAPLQWGRRPAAHAARVFRLVQEVAPWGMMEVFMMGILVALVKLGHMATIVPGVSVFSFGGLIFVMAAAFSTLDPPLLWQRLDLRR